MTTKTDTSKLAKTTKPKTPRQRTPAKAVIEPTADERARIYDANRDSVVRRIHKTAAQSVADIALRERRTWTAQADIVIEAGLIALKEATLEQSLAELAEARKTIKTLQGQLERVQQPS